MNNCLATVLALLLIVSGALFVAYAALSLRRSPVEPAAPIVQKHGEGLMPETATAGARPAPQAGETTVSDSGARPASQAGAASESYKTVLPTATIAAPKLRPTDSPDPTDHTAARRQAAILWVALALPLLFITFVFMVVLRRLRPPPMKHTGPSDTTDLWQEAGKRMK